MCTSRILVIARNVIQSAKVADVPRTTVGAHSGLHAVFKTALHSATMYS